MYHIASTSNSKPYDTNDMLHDKELEIARKQALLSHDMPLGAPMCSLTPPPPHRKETQRVKETQEQES